MPVHHVRKVTCWNYYPSYVLDQNRHKKLGGGVRSLCEISAWTGSMTTCFTSWWNTLSCWTLSQNYLHQHRKFASTLFFVLLMNDKESSLKSQLHPLRKITHALSLPIRIWNGWRGWCVFIFYASIYLVSYLTLQWVERGLGLSIFPQFSPRPFNSSMFQNLKL